MILYQHPFAAYCWKALIALYERDVAFTSVLVEADRSAVAALWPPATLPLLVDGDTVVPESSAVVEYLDRFGDAPPLVTRLSTRVWDRVIDGQVATPMQAIVFDALRPADAKDPYGVDQARAKLDESYSLLDARLGDDWLTGESFTLADCAAAPALHYADVVHEIDRVAHPSLAAYFDRLLARPSVARVIDEARPYREVFPLPWPAHVS
ncbi:glutathione S-transferase family protein [Solirubrobacter soli]|uniref:glutathione S-transferase family protein n=1 Tax=Solirubrobacter soli TaxID=363832 RepID=UPI0003F6AD7F|nr:glutathione S-transferase family protein [Solirubrobacter soli]